jgi:hypothetical protein
MTSLALARDSEGLPITDAEWEDHMLSLMIASLKIAGVDTIALLMFLRVDSRPMYCYTYKDKHGCRW